MSIRPLLIVASDKLDASQYAELENKLGIIFEVKKLSPHDQRIAIPSNIQDLAYTTMLRDNLLLDHDPLGSRLTKDKFYVLSTSEEQSLIDKAPNILEVFMLKKDLDQNYNCHQTAHELKEAHPMYKFARCVGNDLENYM